MSENPTATTLRKAARLMRERAEAATPGPWHLVQSDCTFNPSIGTVHAESAEHLRSDQWIAEAGPGGGGGRENADFIASWHPAVALAVADWLDNAATTSVAIGVNHKRHALAVARAYLGSES